MNRSLLFENTGNEATYFAHEERDTAERRACDRVLAALAVAAAIDGPSRDEQLRAAENQLSAVRRDAFVPSYEAALLGELARLGSYYDSALAISRARRTLVLCETGLQRTARSQSDEIHKLLEVGATALQLIQTLEERMTPPTASTQLHSIAA